MFFFTRIRWPRFTQNDYEKLIEQRLGSSNVVKGDTYQYLALLELQKQASKIAASIYQLRGTLNDSNEIKQLDTKLQSVILEAARGRNFVFKMTDSIEITNLWNGVKAKLKAENTFYCGGKAWSVLFMGMNSILFAAGVAGVILFASVIATGPLGGALLGLGMAVLSALVVGITAYSLYADYRNITDTPTKEIEEGIKFLTIYAQYPEILKENELAKAASNHISLSTI